MYRRGLSVLCKKVPGSNRGSSGCKARRATDSQPFSARLGPEAPLPSTAIQPTTCPLDIIILSLPIPLISSHYPHYHPDYALLVLPARPV